LIQDQLGEIEILLEVGDRLLQSVSRDADAGHDSGNAPAQIRHVVLENAIHIVDIALRVAGNTGISRDHPLERHHRNVLCGRTHAPNGFLVRAASAKTASARARAGGSDAI
jgi:alkylation response protein AidB-like acyl-CoA dehydrogenase